MDRHIASLNADIDSRSPPVWCLTLAELRHDAPLLHTRHRPPVQGGVAAGRGGRGLRHGEVGWDARDAAEHRARSPLGRVPALELDDGTVLFDSTAIVLQLADLYPEAGLVGRLGSQERGDAYAWALTAMTEMEPGSIRWGLAQDEPGRAQYLDCAGVLAEALTGRQFLVGERLGVADFVLAGVLLGLSTSGCCPTVPRDWSSTWMGCGRARTSCPRWSAPSPSFSSATPLSADHHEGAPDTTG